MLLVLLRCLLGGSWGLLRRLGRLLGPLGSLLGDLSGLLGSLGGLLGSLGGLVGLLASSWSDLGAVLGWS